MRLSTSLRLNAQKGLVTPYDPALTLDLQFAARQAYVANIGPLPTFTNSSTTRTFVGSDGLIKTAATNVPRIDFDPVTRLCRGLLIEEQRTNLLSRSEEFDNASWSKPQSSVSANAAVSPDGNPSAEKVIVNNAITLGTSSGAGVRQDISKSASAITYTFSIYAKASELNSVILFLSNGAATSSARATFNLSSGTVGSATQIGSFTGASASVSPVGNGWYRCFLTATSDTDTAMRNAVMPFDTVVTTGNGTSGLFIWGAQVEAGTFATSYIPTTTGSLIRSADVCSITGAAFTGFYNQTEGSVAIKLVKMATYATNPSYLTIDDNSANNRFSFLHNISGPNEQFSLNTLGAAQASFTTTTLSPLTVGGYAGRYKLNDVAWCASGGAVATDVTANMPTVTLMNIGNRQSVGTMSGWIQSIQYYNTIKTNAQLQALSTP